MKRIILPILIALHSAPAAAQETTNKYVPTPETVSYTHLTLPTKA